MSLNWPKKPSVVNFNPSQKEHRKLKREVFGYNWVKRWNIPSFNIWILSKNLFVVKRRARFSVLLQIRFWWVFPSPLNLNICTVNCTTETEGIQWEKDALNSLVSSWNVSFELSFCGGKTKFTHAIAANKRANSHNFKLSNLTILTIIFYAIYFLISGKPSHIN